MFFFGRRRIALVILLFIFMGLCGWFWRHRGSVPFVSQPLAMVAAPFEYGVSGLAGGLRTGVAAIDQVIAGWGELSALREENGILKAEQAKYSEILAENIRLREMLKFKSGYTKFQLLGASVIERDYGVWTNTMVVDRGSDSGLARYMPVIVPGGLVGFVSEVYPNSSRIQLLTDPRTTVGAIVQRPSSRVASMVKENGNNPRELLFVDISRESDVVKGDILVTSGYGGVYPPGLLVGTVDQVEPDVTGVVREAVVTPAADFAHLEEVFIITDRIQKTPPAEIRTQLPKAEPPMDPNARQAGGKS